MLYVEELIGPDTVNTMPPATLDAFRDHGTPRASLEEDVAGAQAVMDALPSAGISIDEITAQLVEDGVRLFADAADQLYAAVQKKRRTVLGSKLNAMTLQAARRSWTTASRRRSKTGARRARCGGCGPATPRCGPRPTRRTGSAG